MSEPTDKSPPQGEAGAPPRPKWARRKPVRKVHGPHFYLRMAALVALFLPVVFAAVASVMMLEREVRAPSWITNRIESEARTFLGGGSIEFGSISITVSRDLHPTIGLSNAVLKDADAAVIARIPRVDVQVSPRGLIFRRELLMQVVRITGAQLTLRRAVDGSVGLAFETGGDLVRQSSTFAGLLGEIDRTLERPVFEALEEVSADGLILSYEDARADRRWTVDGGQVLLDLTGGQTRLRGDFSLLSGRSYVTSMVVNYESARRETRARMGLTVQDAVAGDLATQVPALSWLAALDAPLSASVRAEIDEGGELGPVNAALKIGEGALQPTPDTRPIPFQSAKTYLTYDPTSAALSLNRVEVASSWGSFAADGRALLRDLENGLPRTLLTQVNLSNISLNPDQLFDEPRHFDSASVDFRLQLAPFSVEVGQFAASDGDQTIRGDGLVRATSAGWDVAINAGAETLTNEWILSNWPTSLRATTRKWVEDNIRSAVYRNFAMGARFRPDAAPVVAGSLDFDEAEVRFMKALPPVTGGSGYLAIQGNGLYVSLDQGAVRAPSGGAVDLAGSVFSIPDILIKEAPAQVDLRTDSSITAALSILDLPPFEFLSKANLSVALAEGRASAVGRINLPLKRLIPAPEIDYEVEARMTGVASTVLLPGRVLGADVLELSVTPSGLGITGEIQIERTRISGRWTSRFGPQGGGRSTFEGEFPLTSQVLADFGARLPDTMVSGEGLGRITIDFERGTRPKFRIQSDLAGVTLALPQLGWTKPAGQGGSLDLSGTLSQPPVVESLILDAAGLKLDGEISLLEGGGLEQARFNEASLGGWFDGAVDIVGRGPGQPAGIVIRGGSLDLRRATFGSNSGATGAGGPMTVALDRLQVSEGLALTAMRGDFTSTGGFSGNFTGNLNGQTPLIGTVAPSDGRAAVRIRSDDGGGILRSAGLLQNAAGGTLELILLPTGDVGNYDGQLSMSALRVRDAPALAALLDAISVVGLLQQMDGQGLSFTDVDARFRLTPDRLLVTQSSAVGPGLGISMDGIYTLADKSMDFQGVVSPLYLLNGIGAFLTRPGEGLLGFNYTLRGPASDMQIAVNPLSILTPGMFREIFRRAPPDPDTQ